MRGLGLGTKHVFHGTGRVWDEGRNTCLTEQAGFGMRDKTRVSRNPLGALRGQTKSDDITRTLVESRRSALKALCEVFSFRAPFNT